MSLLSSCLIQQPATGLRVDESATRVILQDNQSAVSLAFENPAPDLAAAGVRLEWVTNRDEADSAIERTLSLPPGKSEAIIPFPLASNPKSEPMWYRLRYRICSGGEETLPIRLSLNND
jgi:hypothetical protein